jgi:hypothetical protein
MDHPYRLVVDFDDTSYGWRKTPLSVDSEPLKQIRGSQYKRGVARVVVELTRSVGYAIREESNGLAIVIPTAPTARGAEPVATAKPAVAKAAAPSGAKPVATAALAVKPEVKDETAKPEAAKAVPVKPETVKPDPMTPVTRTEPASVPAMPQVAQAPAPPVPAPPATAAPVIQTPPGGGPRSSRSTSRTPTSTCSASSPPRADATSSSVRTSRQDVDRFATPWDLAPTRSSKPKPREARARQRHADRQLGPAR